jgi:CysZ protein
VTGDAVLPASRNPPGLARRAAAGAWHVPAGFAYLARNPGLWPASLLPAALAAVCLFLGMAGGLFAITRLEPALLPAPGRVPDVVGFLLMLALWFGGAAAGLLVGLAVALLVAAPALERLSRLVETRVTGRAAESRSALSWELLNAFKGALYFLGAAPLVFLLSLVPFVGPLLGALWGAYALAFQHTDAPLARRGLGFQARRAWHHRWRAESLGFGLAGLVTLVVPIANFLLAPALTVGATLLVLELKPEDEAAPG